MRAQLVLSREIWSYVFIGIAITFNIIEIWNLLLLCSGECYEFLFVWRLFYAELGLFISRCFASCPHQQRSWYVYLLFIFMFSCWFLGFKLYEYYFRNDLKERKLLILSLFSDEYRKSLKKKKMINSYYIRIDNSYEVSLRFVCL
jgi:hypothetical protein